MERCRRVLRRELRGKRFALRERTHSVENQLGDFEDCDELSGKTKKFCDAGLPPKLAQVLEAAAPVYRTHFWPDHDRANRRWIMRVARW